MNHIPRRYGLLTACTMIVGIVIGSGIFFKTDNILMSTGGSVTFGVLLFVLGAVSIVFGSLTIAQLASRTDEPGGIVGYARAFLSPRTACIFGWFQAFVYFPTLTAVVSYVVGVYLDMLFAWHLTLGPTVLVGFCVMSALFVFNTLSARLGGWLQNTATIVKLIPLFFFIAAGLLF